MPRLNSAGPDFNTAPVPAGGQHDLRISSTNDLRRSGREEQLAAAATSEEQRTATSLRLARPLVAVAGRQGFGCKDRGARVEDARFLRVR
jgi:hypothetical protein